MVMDVNKDIVPDPSTLANSNVGNTAMNTRYGGGRGCGRGGNYGGGCNSGQSNLVTASLLSSQRIK